MISKIKSITAMMVVAAFGYAPIGVAQASDCNTGHSSVRTFNNALKTTATKKKQRSLKASSKKKKPRVAKSWK